MNKKKICFASIDVEPDLDKGSFLGVEKLDSVLKIFDDYNIKLTLFVTGDVIEKYPEKVLAWSQKHEIACHNYRHEPLDKLDAETREKYLNKFVEVYTNLLNFYPTGFRAVQHIIDDNQFKLLEKYGFKYDSSIVSDYPLLLNYKGFQGKSPVLPYYKDKVLEIPFSTLLGGFMLYGTWIRYFPNAITKNLIGLKNYEIINLGLHPWDAISYKGRLDRNSGDVFLKKLKNIVECLQEKQYKFLCGQEIYELYKN